MRRLFAYATRSLGRPHVLVALLALVLCVYHVAAIVTFGIGQVDGTRHYLVDDDVMISMSYGRNLARGNGLTYNPGERVEGFTNPLLTLLTALLHLLPVTAHNLAGLIMLINVGLSVLILVMLVRLWHPTAGGGRSAGMLAGLFYVLLPHHAWYAHAGYEVYMELATLLYAVSRIERMRVRDGLILGLLPLTHGTASVLWMLLVAASVVFATERTWRRVAWPTIAALLPMTAYEIFRVVYYGELLPNTYWLKVGGGTLAGGLQYVGGWLWAVAPLVPLAGLGVLRGADRRRWLLVALIGAHTASVMAIGGDILPQYRFLLPCSLMLAALAGLGVSAVLSPGVPLPRVVGDWRPSWGGLRAGAVAVVVLAVASFSMRAFRADRPLYESQQRWNIRHIATGLAINANTPSTARIALFGLGFTGYYADRPTIDMLGKADYPIARVAPTPGRMIGHNKSDVSYVVSRHPDYVELSLSPERFEDVAWLKHKQATDGYGVSYDLALHADFRDRYGPRIVDIQGRKVGFYARNDAPTQVWRLAEEFYAFQETWIER